MDLSFITKMYVPAILVICLAVGYVVKKFIPTDNKWIPLTVTVLGAALGIISGGLTIEAIAAGAVTGLASTGLHQAFSQLIEHPLAGSESGSNYSELHEESDPGDASTEETGKTEETIDTEKESK